MCLLYTPQPDILLDVGIIAPACTLSGEVEDSFYNDRCDRVTRVQLADSETKRILDANARPVDSDTPLTAALLKLRLAFLTHDRPIREYEAACCEVDIAIEKAISAACDSADTDD
jgi:hypothetical protein